MIIHKFSLPTLFTNIKCQIAFMAMVALVLPTAARTAGWDNINPDRKDLPPQKILWTADLAQAKLELRDGAEGSMRTVDADGGKALEIVKTNGKGTIVVKLPPFAVAKKARLRASVRCSSCDGDPEMGDGCVRLFRSRRPTSCASCATRAAMCRPNTVWRWT
jgi:hypothetical protein